MYKMNQPTGVNTPRTNALLDKVFNHLDSIDVTKLSTCELKDFLEVVQKGQFLESYGKMPALGFGGFGGFGGYACASSNPEPEQPKEGDGKTV